MESLAHSPTSLQLWTDRMHTNAATTHGKVFSVPRGDRNLVACFARRRCQTQARNCTPASLRAILQTNKQTETSTIQVQEWRCPISVSDLNSNNEHMIYLYGFGLQASGRVLPMSHDQPHVFLVDRTFFSKQQTCQDKSTLPSAKS